MLIHNGEKPFGCTKCDRRFREKGKMNSHMLMHTGERPFPCPLCGKSYRESRTLKAHLMTHSGEKPFGCTECDRRFRQKDKLKIHMLMHTGEIPFPCPMCEKGFRESRTLKSHLMTHSGEKPFGCTECDRRFRQKDKLKIHMLMHTGKRPFPCPICEKSFRESRTLKAHLMTHSGELIRHVLTHPGENSLRYKQCEKSFSNEKELTNHGIADYKSFELNKASEAHNELEIKPKMQAMTDIINEMKDEPFESSTFGPMEEETPDEDDDDDEDNNDWVEFGGDTSANAGLISIQDQFEVASNLCNETLPDDLLQVNPFSYEVPPNKEVQFPTSQYSELNSPNPMHQEDLGVTTPPTTPNHQDTLQGKGQSPQGQCTMDRRNAELPCDYSSPPNGWKPPTPMQSVEPRVTEQSIMPESYGDHGENQQASCDGTPALLTQSSMTNLTLLPSTKEKFDHQPSGATLNQSHFTNNEAHKVHPYEPRQFPLSPSTYEAMMIDNDSGRTAQPTSSKIEITTPMYRVEPRVTEQPIMPENCVDQEEKQQASCDGTPAFLTQSAMTNLTPTLLPSTIEKFDHKPLGATLNQSQFTNNEAQQVHPYEPRQFPLSQYEAIFNPIYEAMVIDNDSGRTTQPMSCKVQITREVDFTSNQNASPSSIGLIYPLEPEVAIEPSGPENRTGPGELQQPSGEKEPAIGPQSCVSSLQKILMPSGATLDQLKLKANKLIEVNPYKPRQFPFSQLAYKEMLIDNDSGKALQPTSCKTKSTSETDVTSNQNATNEKSKIGRMVDGNMLEAGTNWLESLPAEEEEDSKPAMDKGHSKWIHRKTSKKTKQITSKRTKQRTSQTKRTSKRDVIEQVHLTSSKVQSTSVADITLNQNTSKEKINIEAMKEKTLDADAKSFPQEEKYSTAAMNGGDNFKMDANEPDVLSKPNISHTGEQVFPCDDCDQKFSAPGTRHLVVKLERLKWQYSTGHTMEKAPFCKICHRIFNSPSQLRNHEQNAIHAGQKTLPCNQCDKKFTSSRYLKTHQLTHTEEKPFVCIECDQRFSTSYFLKKHEATHTEEKPFNCNQCDLKFSSSYHFKKHEVTHTGNKPFPCNECEDKFTTRYLLNIHKRTQHTNGKLH